MPNNVGWDLIVGALLLFLGYAGKGLLMKPQEDLRTDVTTLQHEVGAIKITLADHSARLEKIDEISDKIDKLGEKLDSCMVRNYPIQHGR
jgi:predicted  nucleic acid-binding Zn-ribbon protein